MPVFRLGGAVVEVGDELVVTRFRDGSTVTAEIREQPGQAETAARLGMTVTALNRGHDLAHSLLAHFLGLDHSPTLWAVAHGKVWKEWWREEASVLELQGLVNALGLTVEEVAAGCHGPPSPHITRRYPFQRSISGCHKSSTA